MTGGRVTEPEAEAVLPKQHGTFRAEPVFLADDINGAAGKQDIGDQSTLAAQQGQSGPVSSSVWAAPAAAAAAPVVATAPINLGAGAVCLPCQP